MLQKKQKKPSALEKRLKKIESLLNRFKISERQYDILDTAARVEAGALTFDDIYEHFAR